MNCNDKKKFRTSEASSKASLRTKGAIDKFLNILDTNLFRKYNKEWSQDARERFSISGSLFYEENNKAVPNKEAFYKIDKAKKQHNGTQYQLESNLINPAIEELDNFLLDFLRNFNVKSKQFDELKSRLGVNALGATDILNKLIWYTKNRNEETLPEEAAHMLVALMGENHPDIKELLANVSNWSEYQSIKDQYLPIYKDENKVKIEAVGKLIAKALVKNYKANGLDKNKLQKALENILNFIENILNSLNISDAFFYNENIADHIAINVLSGNKDYIYKIKNFNPNLNAKKEINNNPHAKKIINMFSSSSVKMTGSLAIAGTENIRRPKGQGIHDIDFKVKSFEVFNKEILPKIPENAVPAHFGWHKRDYSTFAYLIPTEGYRIEVIERKDDFSNGWITDYKLYNEKNEQVEITQQNIISVDFFVYKEGVSPKDFDFSSNFIPTSLVYEGKMSLGGKSNPYFFSRDKDQEDYVLRNPKSFIPFEKHIYYQLNNNSQESLGNIKKEAKPVSPKMLKFVKEFIKQIGVDYQKVDKIVVNGKVVDANGIARMMSKLIQVVEGKESVALPEEAMHFAVEIIEQTNPKLFEQMLKDINGEAVYQQINTDYGKNPYYQKDGKPDIRKLKKEAIGKLLVDKVSSIKAQTWWDKIVKFLKELFNKPQMDGVDGLTQFAEMIVSGEDFGTVNDIKSSEDYFQLNEQDKVFNKLKDLDNQITKEDDGVNDDGDPRQSYFIGEKKIKHRVTDFVSDWYKKIFKGEQTEYQKRLAELKAEEGTKGHYHFEKAFDTFVDPDTGLLREEFLEDDDQYLSTLSQVDKDIYATLKENLRDRLLSFPEGSKFLKEAKIYDGRETAGTVDLLIVDLSGKVSIIDWKFIDINTDKYEDVPWYKVKAWNLQMEKYRGILTKNYGVKEEDFKQTRMIPILAIYTDADYQGQNLPKLRGIKIGSVNAQNVNEDYLLYVGFKERTGDEKIDNLLDKMNNVYSKISNEKVSPEDRALKNEQLNSLYKAIRHLEIKKDIVPLVNQGKVLNKQVSNFIKKYNDNIKDKSKEELGKEKINEFAGMIRVHMEALQPYLDIRQLKYLLNETNPEFNEIKSKLRDTVEDVQDYLDQLESIDKEFGKKFVGASYTAEKVVKGITRWFGNAATIQLENLQRLFTLANEATAISNFEVSDEVKKLEELKEKYINWAISKGLSTKDYFKMIMKSNKNELINQYDSNFYKELKTAVAKKDFRWILDNVDKVEVIKKIKEQEEREIDAALNYPIVGSEEHVKSEINKKIAKIKDKYDVSTSTSKGWLQEQFIKVPTVKWESKEWKTLHEKDSSENYVNQPAIDFYNYIIEKNKLYKEIGYLTGKSSITFLPWIRKGFLEGVVLDGKPQGSLDQFLRNISVDENETTYGQIDPLTGKVIDTIPIHFVNQLDGEYSTDLFSTMFLYNEFAIKYKNLSQIEEQAILLLRAEQNKQSIMTSIFGNVIKKGESFDYNNNNLENTKLYESFMKSIIYQQKYINNEEFDIMLGKISGFGKKFNDKLGMKIFPEDMESRYLTVNKTLDQMNRAFQLQALGLNALSSISNMFGGTANAMINAGKYFTKDDYLKTQAKFLWEKLQGDENAGKILAAVDYFAPFVDSYNRDAKKKLSLSKLTPEGIQDFLMIGLKKGDEMIQYMNAFTFIKNMIVIDGQVKNVREYLRSTDEYKDFYAGNADQRKERKEKFEEDVNKLIEEKGLLNVSKLSEEGTLEIPGIERKSDSIIEQRRIIQQFTSDALGSLTEENRRLINMNVYGSSLMVFKNWIPRLVDVRVGGLKYNAAYQAYEWGRYRTFYSMVIPDILKTIKSLTGAVTGNSDVWLEQVRQMFEKQKEEYFNSTGKELKMTESEFISLVNQNIKNQALDLMILTTLLAIGTVAKAMAPDDDEDENVKNVYRFMLKATDKVTDELAYFYNPMTPFNLISTKGVFPSVGILNNYAKFIKDFALENYGMIINDDEIVDDAKPIKYLMKSFPVSSQVAAYLPMFYPELAKDLGIRMQSTYGVR